VFTWARKQKIVPLDCEPFDSVKVPAEPLSKREYLTYDDERRLREAIRQQRGGGEWLERAFSWMIGTGMDRGDVCELRQSAVNFENGTVAADRLKTAAAGKGARIIYLNATLLAILKDVRRSRGKVTKISDRARNGRVFLSQNGEPIKPDAISRAMRRAFERAGIPHPSCGCVKILRHTFGTRLMQACGNLRIVQDALGHADPGTTASYAANSNEQMRDAMALLEKNGGAV